MVDFIDPANGTIVESDPTSTGGGAANAVAWIAHHKGEFYVGIGPSRSFNGLMRNEYVNSSLSSNSFTSFGNSSLVQSLGTSATYGSLAAFYSRALGALNITGLPYGSYHSRATFSVPPALFNTTPSIGGNVTYLLSNDIYFQAYRSGGQVFNALLPGSPTLNYNYSDIALAYGNAYVTQGGTLYVFGAGGFLPQNTSILGALGDLYLNGRGGLADYMLYKTYGSGNIGIFINGTPLDNNMPVYAPSLYVSKFNGVDSYIKIPATAKLSPEAGSTGAMSLCGWYKINTLAGYNGIVFQGTQSPSSGSIPEFSVDNASYRGFRIYSSSGAVVAAYGNALNNNMVGLWNSFCFTYNQSFAYYYLNGTQYPATLNVGVTPSVGSGAIIVGAGIPSTAGPAGYSNVSLADLQLYNVSLSLAAAQGIYRSGMYGTPPNATGLVGWWPLLGDGNDYSGNSHVGYPSNTAFISSNQIPSTLSRAVQIGSSVLPLQLTSNGIPRIYNISVVVWTN